MTDEKAAALSDRIEAIESGYEFLLAYAAQGRETNQGSEPGEDVREFLRNMDHALEGLGEIIKADILKAGNDETNNYQSFLDAVDNDAKQAQGAIRLVLSRASIGSQLIDNLNANVHLRALLTDLFLIDEAIKS